MEALRTKKLPSLGGKCREEIAVAAGKEESIGRALGVKYAWIGGANDNVRAERRRGRRRLW